MDWAWPQRGKVPFTLVRGLVFQDGRRLTQVADLAALATNTGAFWVDRTNQVLHARFLQDADPARALIEVTTQETVFAPEQPGLGFIRVKGFVVEHAAGPFPWEQVGAISPTRGHHWIIEDCTVRQVNGVGLDLGIQHPRWPQPPQVGFHIVRRNVVTDCGICGLCGLGPGRGRETGLLIEDNVVLRNAWHDAELLWETGGIKTHCSVCCLIRRNQVANNLLVGNAKPDEFRGEPSVVTNHVSLAGGIRLNKETLELRIEEVPTLEREPAFVAPVRHDFFSHERSRTVTAVGPFAATPAKGSIVRLRPDAVPAQTEAWLGQRLDHQDQIFARRRRDPVNLLLILRLSLERLACPWVDERHRERFPAQVAKVHADGLQLGQIGHHQLPIVAHGCRDRVVLQNLNPQTVARILRNASP
jgi:hypothetical protein